MIANHDSGQIVTWLCIAKHNFATPTKADKDSEHRISPGPYLDNDQVGFQSKNGVMGGAFPRDSPVK